jgi:hypothetical protein
VSGPVLTEGMRTSSAPKPSVLHIVIEDRGLDTYPSVYNALYLWHRHGWTNDVATACDCAEFSELIDSVHRLEPGARIFPAAKRLSRLDAQYDLVITYEPKDLEALYLCQLFHKKIHYRYHLHHSLEIPSFAFENSRLKTLLHRLALRRAMETVDAIVIQDRLRYNLLRGFFPSVAGKPLVIVPNSHLDAVEPSASSLEWFDDIRKNAETLILYVGGIERWVLSTAIMDEIATLPAYTFLFSGWSRDGYHEELTRRYAEYGHIIFDVRKKSRRDLNYIVSRSDIGLAIYDSSDDVNVSHIGLSSGNFKYVQHNKPVIISDIPLLSPLVARHGIGSVYEPGNLGHAVADIVGSQGYPRSFGEKMSYERHYAKVMELFESPGARLVCREM